MISWTPYALVSIYNMFFDGSCTFVTDATALLAKSSVVWSTLIYILKDDCIRHRTLWMLCRRSSLIQIEREAQGLTNEVIRPLDETELELNGIME